MQERAKGVASELWGRGYDPNPVPRDFKLPSTIRFVPAAVSTRFDPMCDYIEDAEWWIARSDSSVRMLLKAFAEQNVPCLLYERTGAIVELGRQGKQWLIGIQIVRQEQAHRDWDLDLSLSDAGIYLEELYIEESND